MISAGQMQVQFSVSIMDDAIVESDENFILIISSTSLSDKISIDSPNRTSITILDNDGQFNIIINMTMAKNCM